MMSYGPLQEIIDFLYDWQVLITGLLVLLAAHVWAHATVRAASAAAEKNVLRSLRSRSSPSTPRSDLRIEPIVNASPPGNSAIAPKNIRPVAIIERYRDRIRTTLVKIPYSDEPLTKLQLELCKPVEQFPMDASSTTSELAAQHSARLRAELSALGQVREGEPCRRLWDALVRVNRAARELAESLAAETANLPAE